MLWEGNYNYHHIYRGTEYYSTCQFIQKKITFVFKKEWDNRDFFHWTSNKSYQFKWLLYETDLFYCNPTTFLAPGRLIVVCRRRTFFCFVVHDYTLVHIHTYWNYTCPYLNLQYDEFPFIYLQDWNLNYGTLILILKQPKNLEQSNATYLENKQL
jgi:hypothetical protein